MTGANRLETGTAIVGVADHGGWAILVTVAPDASLLDRRRVELIAEGLPKLPHHHDAQGLPMPEAVALVERVRRSAEECSKACLDALAAALPLEVAGIALRTCPALPATVEERITNYRAQNNADWVMYRTALAQAAAARGWFVHWYDARRAMADAARALAGRSVEQLLENTGTAIGPPWQKDHQQAMAAAIAASSSRK